MENDHFQSKNAVLDTKSFQDFTQTDAIFLGRTKVDNDLCDFCFL